MVFIHWARRERGIHRLQQLDARTEEVVSDTFDGNLAQMIADLSSSERDTAHPTFPSEWAEVISANVHPFV